MSRGTERRKLNLNLRLPPLNAKSSGTSPLSVSAKLSRRSSAGCELAPTNSNIIKIVNRSASPSSRKAVRQRLHKRNSSAYAAETKPTINPAMFTFGKCLGRGKMGRILRTEINEEEYAVKLVEREAERYAHAERDALNNLSHASIVRLHNYTEDAQFSYLVLELIQGEDLFHFMRRKRPSRQVAAKIAAQVLLTLEYIHDQGYVYRDLKPENIMVMPTGDIKFIDFGFAKLIKEDRTYTMVGSPEYMAPEVILKEGHNKAADWWSYGILLYELLCGQPPFQGDNIQGTYDEILRGALEFSRNIEPSAKDIIRKLLTRVPSIRLGNLAGGAGDLKRHKFFTGIDWNCAGAVTVAVLEFN